MSPRCNSSVSLNRPAPCSKFQSVVQAIDQCKPPNSQIRRMIGNGMPISQSKRPLPINLSLIKKSGGVTPFSQSFRREQNVKGEDNVPVRDVRIFASFSEPSRRAHVGGLTKFLGLVLCRPCAMRQTRISRAETRSCRRRRSRRRSAHRKARSAGRA